MIPANPPTILKPDGTLDGRLTQRYLQQLHDHNRELESRLSQLGTQGKAAPLIGSGPVTTVAELWDMLKAGGEHAINVQSLLGQLANPQLTYVPIVQSLPINGDPLSQGGQLVLLESPPLTYSLYVYDERPGVVAQWILVFGSGSGGGVRPSVRAYNDANISIPNATQVAIPYNQERYDAVIAMHDPAINNNRLTVTVPGRYVITLNLAFAPNATGIRAGIITLNGGTIIAADSRMAVTTGDNTLFSVSTEYVFIAGNYADSAVYQNSGGALNLLSIPNYSPEFSMAQVSD